MNCILCGFLVRIFAAALIFMWRNSLFTQSNKCPLALLHIWSKMSHFFSWLIVSTLSISSFFLLFFLCFPFGFFFSYIRCMRFFIRFFPIHLGMVQCTVKIRKTICIFEACNHWRVKIELIISSMCGLQWNYSSKSNVPLYWISMKSTMIHSHSLMSIPHQIKSCPELKRWFYLLNFQSRFTFRCSCFFRVNFNSTDWISDFNSIISHYSHFILCIQNEKEKTISRLSSNLNKKCSVIKKVKAVVIFIWIRFH